MLRENETRLQDHAVLFRNDFYSTLQTKSKAESVHERCQGKSPVLSTRYLDRVLINPFVSDPLMKRESPGGRATPEEPADAPL